MAGERLRIVATLIRTTGDWDLAEDAVADAAERALKRWVGDGIPDRPAAWLTTTARRCAIDTLRRRNLERSKLAELEMYDRSGAEPTPRGRSTTTASGSSSRAAIPRSSMEARVALTLKVVSNLSTAAIARVFLTSENTMGQRILRAKGKIANAGIPYRVPKAEELPERVDGVLAVVYLLFTTGYSPTMDDDLVAEAIRLGRLVVGLMPESDEARGLLALMLIQRCPPGRAHRRRRTRHAREPGPLALGRRCDQRGAFPDRRAGKGARAVPRPGRARFRPRHRARRRLDRLAAHRRPVRRAAGDPPVADRGAQPSRRRRDE